MPTRVISLTDARKRDAHVEIESPKPKQRYGYVNAQGEKVQSERFVKLTETHSYEAMLDKFGDDESLAQALIEGDPELDLEKTGRRVGSTDRVFVRTDGTMLYTARTLMVRYDAKGNEIDREDFIDVEANVTPDDPIPWSGKLVSVDDVVRKYVIGRKLRVRHVNGLTFDFLYDIARHLSEEKQMLQVGMGTRGKAPLIFQTNGTPYRGFLEGRVDEDGYLLLLHLSNLELKRISDGDAS